MYAEAEQLEIRCREALEHAPTPALLEVRRYRSDRGARVREIWACPLTGQTAWVVCPIPDCLTLDEAGDLVQDVNAEWTADHGAAQARA
jgi:hypothetical protein